MIPRLHLVTDDRVVCSKDFLPRAKATIRAGGPELVIHLRTRALSSRRVLEIGEDLLEVSRAAGGRLSLNDRLDIALAMGTGWCHLGGSSIPTGVVRRIVCEEMTIGVSVHELGEVSKVVSCADYLMAGNVFETLSHPQRPARGVAYVREVIERYPLPVIAVGGVTISSVPTLASVGVHGVAVLSGIWDAGDPEVAVTRYLQAF